MGDASILSVHTYIHASIYTHVHLCIHLCTHARTQRTDCKAVGLLLYNVFSDYRMCSLTIQCVLLLQIAKELGSNNMVIKAQVIYTPISSYIYYLYVHVICIYITGDIYSYIYIYF